VAALGSEASSHCFYGNCRAKFSRNCSVSRIARAAERHAGTKFSEEVKKFSRIYGTTASNSLMIHRFSDSVDRKNKSWRRSWRHTGLMIHRFSDSTFSFRGSQCHAQIAQFVVDLVGSLDGLSDFFAKQRAVASPQLVDEALHRRLRHAERF
jgi:hypothetical protein